MTRLDPKLLNKLSTKLNKNPQYIREQISKKANRGNVSSEAAMVIWAKSLGIGVGRYVSSLQPHLQNEIRLAPVKPIEMPAVARSIKNPSNQKNVRNKLYDKWWVKQILLPLAVVIIGAFIVFKLGWI